MELERFSVSELSKEESIEITGGSFWSVMGNILGALAAVGVLVLAAIGIDHIN